MRCWLKESMFFFLKLCIFLCLPLLRSSKIKHYFPILCGGGEVLLLVVVPVILSLRLCSELSGKFLAPCKLLELATSVPELQRLELGCLSYLHNWLM